MKSYDVELPAGEVLPPTKDLLVAVSAALRGDDSKVRKLVAKARTDLRKRAIKELRGALPKVRKPKPKRKPVIAGARPAPPVARAPLPSRRGLAVRLPGGRRTQLTTHADVLRDRKVTRTNELRAVAAIRKNGEAIDRLAAAQTELAAKLVALSERGDLALLNGILGAITRLEGRVDNVRRQQTRALAVTKKALDHKIEGRTRLLRTRLSSQVRAVAFQKINAVASSVQVAAFGERGSLTSRNNLLLGGNQLLWSILPDALGLAGVQTSTAKTMVGLLAPLGNLAVGRLTLGRQQHERFVSGITTSFTDGALAFMSRGARVRVAVVQLRSRIAPAAWARFSTRTDVVATAHTLDDPTAQTAAVVRAGALYLATSTTLPNPRVAWTVDAKEPGGS